MRTTFFAGATSVLLVSALLLAACGGDDDGAAGDVDRDDPVAVANQVQLAQFEGDPTACDLMTEEWQQQTAELAQWAAQEDESVEADEDLSCGDAVSLISEQQRAELGAEQIDEALAAGEEFMETGEVVEDDGERAVVAYSDNGAAVQLELLSTDGDWFFNGPVLEGPEGPEGQDGQ